MRLAEPPEGGDAMSLFETLMVMVAFGSLIAYMMDSDKKRK